MLFVFLGGTTMDEIREFTANFVELIPRAFLALVMLVLALLVSFFLKRLAINGLNKINFKQRK